MVVNMKIEHIKVKNTYTCQGCHNTFISYGDLIFEQDVWPVCCKQCEFKVIYKLLKKCEFSDKNLEFMAKNTKFYDQKQEFIRHKALFAICKHYANIGLANIKYLGTKDKDKNQGTNKRPKSRDKFKGHTPLIRGMSFVPCPKSPNSQFVPKSNSGDLQKWF